MIKIFISYTVRDGKVDKTLLTKINNSFKEINDVEIYIDMIHNVNLLNPQKYVIERLLESDFLLVIKTEAISLSPWVKKEIEIAMHNNCPIYYIDINEMIRVTQKKSSIIALLNSITKGAYNGGFRSDLYSI